MRFVEYPPKSWKDILEGVSDLSVSFISHLVVYEPSARMTASNVSQTSASEVELRITQALRHAWIST